MDADEARLLLTDAAIDIVGEHRPVDGLCPVCRVAVCRMDEPARAYLQEARRRRGDGGPL